MIKLQDLRIGNYLRCNDVEMSSYFIVNKIHKTMITDFIEPIPLTEKILLECGFTKDKRIGYSNNIEIEYCIFYKKLFLFNENLNQWFLNNVQIKLEFLHQLQNIYWDLYQEDLEINF